MTMALVSIPLEDITTSSSGPRLVLFTALSLGSGAMLGTR